MEPTVNHTVTKRTKAALWALIAPTALLIVTFTLFAIINWVLNPTMWPKPDSEMFAPTPIGITIANVILFLTGTISIITWLPGVVIGVILLASAKK